MPLRHLLAAVLLALAAGPALAQTTVSGTVRDGAQPLAGVNVVLDGTFVGRATDGQGRFTLPVDFAGGPRTLVFTFTGFQTQRIALDAPVADLVVTMLPDVLSGGDVIVSASRVEESILEAPVTVERVSAAQLERLPQTEIVSSLERYKGIDVSRSSLLISSLSTRGFNSAKSERVVQLIDNVDFVAPSLSLYTGTLTGVPEIDIEGIEVVHGANSALYGANAFNGVVLFQTKSPFQHEGVSASVRGGSRTLLDAQVRVARRFGDRLAAKLTASYFEADDFIAANGATLTTIPDNITGVDAEGTTTFRAPDDPRGADRVNRYGEVVVLRPTTPVAPGVTLGNLGLDGPVFTPGFTEADLVLGEARARALRVGGQVSALVTDRVRATADLRYGEGNGLYQSSNRYAFDGINAWTGALAVEGDRWTVRAYTTRDASGDTYDLGFLGSFMNRQPFETADGQQVLVPVNPANPAAGTRPALYAEVFAQTYATAFATARAQGRSIADAYAAATAATATLYPTLGDPRLERARAATLGVTTPGQSPGFTTASTLSHAEAQVRASLPGAVEATLGASARAYRLTSNGTLFADGPNASPLANPATGERAVRDGINNSEAGGYLQLRRAFLGDALTLSAVGRVDAFRNFETRVSPRVSGVYSFGPGGQHNLRASFSQAYRAPAQLDQFIYLDVGQILLVGNTGEGFESASINPATFGQPTGRIEPLRLEQMTSVEVGYKGLVGGRLLVDVSYYRSLYDDFIGTRRFLGREDGSAPTPAEFNNPAFAAAANRSRVLQTWLNAEQEVTTQGAQVALEYALDRRAVLAANYTWSDIEDVPDLILGFNTPAHKANLGVSGQITDALAYGTNLRISDTYAYAMPFAEGMIEGHAVWDAQLSYAFPTFGVTLLAGATNLTNSRNVTAFGSAPMERIVYAGLRYAP